MHTYRMHGHYHTVFCTWYYTSEIILKGRRGVATFAQHIIAYLVMLPGERWDEDHILISWGDGG